MKRTLLLLLLGLTAGSAAHLLYYRWHAPADINSLDAQLAWMKTELNLTDTQYARIKELHQASGPRLRALAAQVAELQKEFAAFEESRRTNDRVDFIDFARFVEARRHVDRECQDSTRQLVAAAAEVMTPTQRQRYIQLLATAEPLAQSLLN
jgi:Spy/CpxP family protein refolding chaperone